MNDINNNNNNDEQIDFVDFFRLRSYNFLFLKYSPVYKRKSSFYYIAFYYYYVKRKNNIYLFAYNKPKR